MNATLSLRVFKYVCKHSKGVDIKYHSIYELGEYIYVVNNDNFAVGLSEEIWWEPELNIGKVIRGVQSNIWIRREKKKLHLMPV